MENPSKEAYIAILLNVLTLLSFNFELTYKNAPCFVNDTIFSISHPNCVFVFQQISYFLFCKLNRRRARQEFADCMPAHTKKERTMFLNQAYKWLTELKKSSSLFLNVVPCKSVFTECRGELVAKTMATFAVFVLQQNPRLIKPDKMQEIIKSLAAVGSSPTSPKKKPVPVASNPPSPNIKPAVPVPSHTEFENAIDNTEERAYDQENKKNVSPQIIQRGIYADSGSEGERDYDQENKENVSPQINQRDIDADSLLTTSLVDAAAPPKNTFHDTPTNSPLVSPYIAANNSNAGPSVTTKNNTTKPQALGYLTSEADLSAPSKPHTSARVVLGDITPVVETPTSIIFDDITSEDEASVSSKPPKTERVVLGDITPADTSITMAENYDIDYATFLQKSDKFILDILDREHTPKSLAVLPALSWSADDFTSLKRRHEDIEESEAEEEEEKERLTKKRATASSAFMPLIPILSYPSHDSVSVKRRHDDVDESEKEEEERIVKKRTTASSVASSPVVLNEEYASPGDYYDSPFADRVLEPLTPIANERPPWRRIGEGYDIDQYTPLR